MRTHFCGLVDEALVGQTVTLCGWADVARNLGGLCFIDLRDHEGIVQVLVEPEQADVMRGNSPSSTSITSTNTSRIICSTVSCTSRSDTHANSMSSWVNSSWRSARRASSRKQRAIW